MPLKIFFQLMVISLVASPLKSQTSGFLGKRHTVALASSIANPLFYNLNSSGSGDGYLNNTYSDGVFKEKSNLIEIGSMASYSFALTRSFGLVLNGYYEPFKLFFQPGYASSTWISSNGLPTVIMGTYIPGESMKIAPGVMFSLKQGVLPFGLSQEFGFGIGRIGLSSENVAIRTSKVNGYFDQNGQYIEEIIIKDFTDDEVLNDEFKYPLRGIYYKLKMLYPVSDNLLIHFGLNYQYNWVPVGPGFDNFDATHTEVLNSVGTTYLLKDKIEWGFLRLEIGAAFPFSIGN